MRHQVCFDDGSADHSFSHSALLAVIEYSMALARSTSEYLWLLQP